MEMDGTDKVMVIACFFQVVEDTTSPQLFRDLANGVSSVSPPPGAPTVPLNFKDMAQVQISKSAYYRNLLVLNRAKRACRRSKGKGLKIYHL